jgi:hypothetical protein
METIQTAQHGQTMIDGLCSGLGRMLQLIVNILKQKGLVEPSQRVVFGLEPSSRM